MSDPRRHEDLILVGDRWDHADALAARLRMDVILDMLSGPGHPVERDTLLPARRLNDIVIGEQIRTSAYGRPDGGMALVTYEPAEIACRSEIHVRAQRHPRLKDMTLSIRYDRLLVPEPDATSIVRSVTRAMGRYEADLARRGRGCHRAASMALREIMDMLVQQCASTWRGSSGVPMKIINMACPTPWTDMANSVDNPDGLLQRPFLSDDASRIVGHLLPTAMTVDWTDKQDQGTGKVTSRLSFAPLGTVGITSSQTDDDPMMHLRNLERLRLPEGAILDLP